MDGTSRWMKYAMNEWMAVMGSLHWWRDRRMVYCNSNYIYLFQSSKALC